MDANAQQLSKRAEWEKFVDDSAALCRQSADGWTPDAENAYQKLMEIPYAKALRYNRKVQSAIKELEESFLAQYPHAPSLHGAEPAKRRRLLFFARYAAIVQYSGSPMVLKRATDIKAECRKAARRCRDLKVLLEFLDQDHYFVESLGQNSAQLLHETPVALEALAEILANASPKFPHENSRGRTQEAFIVDQLAECCWRIYQCCNEAIIRGLLKVEWMSAALSLPSNTLKIWINRARDRKIENYENRMVEGELTLSVKPRQWEPPKSLD